MSDEEKKKKSNKVTFMLAFAATVVGSAACALSASAAEAPTDETAPDDNQVTNTAQDEIGSNEAYLKCGSNVYIASEEAKAVADFNNEFSGLKGFTAYTKDLNMYGIHVEGNICADKVNKFDVYNTNVADNFIKNGVEAPSVYTCYMAEPPQDGGTEIKLGIYDGTSYELVLGFDFEEVELDHGNKKGFVAGGKQYTIECQNKADKVTLRRANENDDFTKISENLSSMAQAGAKLIEDVGYSAEESGSSLRDAAFAIQCGYVQPGQTLVASVNSNDLRANGEYIRNLLANNGGVKVIINVITDDDTTYVDMGVVNDAENERVNWNTSNANVVFNFGDYAHDIKTSQMGGIVVAPNAHFFNDGVFSGSIFANDIKMNNEIHQVVADNEVPPVEDETPEEETPTNEDTDEDVVKDTPEDNTEEEDETSGGDEPEPEDEEPEEEEPEEEPEEEDTVDEEDETAETDDVPEEEPEETPEEVPDEEPEDNDEVVDDTPEEEPPVEEPTEEEPPVEEPTEEEPTEEEPPVEEPTEEEPTEEEPPVEEPTEEEPPVEEPTEEEPVEEEPPVEEPTEEEPTEEEPPVEEPTEEEPVEEEVPEEVAPEAEEEPEEPVEVFDEVDEVDENEEDLSEEEPVVPEETPEPDIPEEEESEVPETAIIIDEIELDDNSEEPVTPPETNNDNQINDFVIIEDDEVPLADNPYTGVEDTAAGAVAIGSAIVLGAAAAASIKRKNKKS